ncbi:uncharacterized protein LOC143836782 isoform X2 [Paroedura picta]|uniref:uncharacterized protein LOC143836782 isoform X2 n=1 Tax=Paroedura picta TaxID=143630 RepID=UPI004056B78C
MPLSTKKWQIGTKDFWVHAECKEAQECSRGKQESQEDNFSAKLDASQFLNQKFEKDIPFPGLLSILFSSGFVGAMLLSLSKVSCKVNPVLVKLLT